MISILILLLGMPDVIESLPPFFVGLIVLLVLVVFLVGVVVLIGQLRLLFMRHQQRRQS